jgi:hypothetical protein
MFDQTLKEKLLEYIDGSKSISDSKKTGKKNGEIKILCIATGKTRNNFLLKTLIAETSHEINIHHISSGDEESENVEKYIQYFKKNYKNSRNKFSQSRAIQNKQRSVIGLTNEDEEVLETIHELCRNEHFDAVIFDYFLDDLSDPVKSSGFYFKLNQLFSSEQHVPDFLFPFKNINSKDFNADIFINLPIELINFEEIIDPDRNILDEVLKDEKDRNNDQIYWMVDRSYRRRGELNALFRYLISKTSTTNILFFIANYGDKINKKMYLHAVCDLLLFHDLNCGLIDRCLEKSESSDWEINQILIYHVNKFAHLQEDSQGWHAATEFFYNRFKELVTEDTKMRLTDLAQRSGYMNEKLLDFLVKRIDCSAAESVVRLVNLDVTKNVESDQVHKRLNHILENFKEKILSSDLNKALILASKINGGGEIVERLIEAGANPEILKNKNYGWSKFLSTDLVQNAVEENHVEWIRSNFLSYVETMNDFLFDVDYGYYASGIVKIGGQAADFSTNVTNGKGFAFLLALLAIEKWKAAKKPNKFIILELCGGNGKLANDILTIIEILSASLPELSGLFDSVIYRTVDISHGLSKVQQARNKKFSELGKFDVIISDASDKKWLEKFEFKNEAGIVFCNELIDQFIPNAFVTKNVNGKTKIFNPYSISHLLVNNFDDFYKLCEFEGLRLLSRDEALETYSNLKKSSDEHRKKFQKYFEINCADDSLIVSHKDLRDLIIFPILKPRLDKVRSLRYKIFELEEEIEERRRQYNSPDVKMLKAEISNIINALQPIKKDMMNVWNQLMMTNLILPHDDANIGELDLKYASKCHLYPDDYQISYQETQFENLLKILTTLAGYEFFIFEYGKLPTEKDTRIAQYYGFSWLIDDADLYSGIQKKNSENAFNEISDIYSKFFLGVDITIELDFKKAEEMAFAAGFKKIGLLGNQKILDDYLKNSDLEFYKKSLEILKTKNDYNNIKKEVNDFREWRDCYKIMSLSV